MCNVGHRGKMKTSPPAASGSPSILRCEFVLIPCMFEAQGDRVSWCYSCLSDSTLSRKPQRYTACPGKHQLAGAGRGRAGPGLRGGRLPRDSALCSFRCRLVLLGNVGLSHKAYVYNRRGSHSPRRPAGPRVLGCCYDVGWPVVTAGVLVLEASMRMEKLGADGRGCAHACVSR